MLSTIVEVTNNFNWGKFMVAQFSDEEWDYRTRIPHPPDLYREPPRLLRQNGWGPDSRWVLDLQTGEGALFVPKLPVNAVIDLEKRKIWVCPMYPLFLTWFYEHKEHHADVRTLPPLLEFTDAEAMKASALYGYRRRGPTGPTAR